jgi:hypothetical protein
MRREGKRQTRSTDFFNREAEDLPGRIFCPWKPRAKNRAFRSNLFYRFAVKKDFRCNPSAHAPAPNCNHKTKVRIFARQKSALPLSRKITPQFCGMVLKL